MTYLNQNVFFSYLNKDNFKKSYGDIALCLQEISFPLFIRFYRNFDFIFSSQKMTVSLCKY